MPVFISRNKVISIRVSDKEFQNLQDVCMQEGARSLSDFARRAVEAAVDARTHRRNESLDATLEALGLRLDALERSMRELTRAVLQHDAALWPEKKKTSGI